uniref:Uncharacterized protein n=1 Tax=Desulfobacca acetoxidans TaxID=60893 RepID=A0A7C5AKQ9_9BACT
MLEKSEFITVYWLSGWFQEKFEIWKGRKDQVQSDPESVGFTIHLLLPLTEEEPSHLRIFSRGRKLSFSVEWFPGEEFPLKAYFSENPREMLLMAEFQRESVFLHLT